MVSLPGYAYYRKGAVAATVAGEQTNYQLELVVGESSGAAGADVDCGGHCEDFPNDIRFTEEDGTTKHDYWVDISSLEGIAPNRKVSVWIEVASIPASGSVDFYMYYGNSGDSGESDGDSTFNFFDDFDYNFMWEHLGNARCEDLEVVGDYIYYAFPSSPAVIKKYNKSDLSYVASLTLSNNDIEKLCTDGSSYLYVGQQSGKIAKVSLASFTEIAVLTLTQGTSVVAGLHIVGDYLYAGRGGGILARILLSDFSTVNYLLMAAGTGYAEPGANDGTYLYVPGDDSPNLAKLNKVKLSDFTLHSSITLSKEEGQQNPIIDNGYLYVACEGTNWNGALVKINLSTFTETSALVFTGKGRIKNVFKSGTYLYSPSYLSDHGYWHKIAISTFTESQECDMGQYRLAEAERLVGDYLYFGIDAGTTWTDCYLGKMRLDDFGDEEGPWEDNKDPFDKWVEYNTPTIDWSEDYRLRLKDDGEVVTVNEYGPNIRIRTRQYSGEQDCKWIEISENPYDVQNRITYYNTDGAEHNGRYLELASMTEISDVLELHYSNDYDDIRAWNIYEITWAPSHVIFFQNGNLVYDHTANIIQSSDHVYIKVWDSSVDANPKIDADWICISKYVSPEPTWDAWGSEGKTTEKILLKLLQKKGLNIDLLQKLKGLSLDLSQEDKGINLKLS